MKIKVKVQDQYYEVEILDLNSRPVIAIVDGQEFEVWPQDAASLPTAQLSSEKPAITISEPQVTPSSKASSTSQVAIISNALRAPIPGVVVAIKVNPGEAVSLGQELLVLEAMKMRNAIRSPRDGIIESVKVAAGQTVNHNDLLIEFAKTGKDKE